VRRRHATVTGRIGPGEPCSPPPYSTALISAWLVPGRRRWCITRDTMLNMTEVTIRELRNHGGEVVDRVAQGEQITITRGGRPVAELRPVSRQPLTAEALLARWHRLPPVDYRAMRAEIDEVMDPAL